MLFKMIYLFVKSAILGLLLSFISIIVEIMMIGVINVLFETGISHNNNFVIFSFWILFISLTLLLFFKFTSLKEKETELDFFTKYSSNLKTDYIIAEIMFLDSKKTKISFLNLFYYQKEKFIKAHLIPFNMLKNANLDFEKQFLVFKDYNSFLVFNKFFKTNNYAILNAEFYLSTYRHSLSLFDMLDIRKIIVRRDSNIYTYIEEHYNKYFVLNCKNSEVNEINSLYLSFLRGDVR